MVPPTAGREGSVRGVSASERRLPQASLLRERTRTGPGLPRRRAPTPGRGPLGSFRPQAAAPPRGGASALERC